jgi:hypothetical protein
MIVTFIKRLVTAPVSGSSYNSLIHNQRRPIMTDFFIDEDFPCSQVEIDKRFSTEQACRDYLIAQI